MQRQLLLAHKCRAPPPQNRASLERCHGGGRAGRKGIVAEGQGVDGAQQAGVEAFGLLLLPPAAALDALAKVVGGGAVEHVLLHHIRRRVKERAVRKVRLRAVLHLHNHVLVRVAHAQVYNELALVPHYAAKHCAFAFDNLQVAYRGHLVARQPRASRREQVSEDGLARTARSEDATEGDVVEQRPAKERAVRGGPAAEVGEKHCCKARQC